MIDFYLYHHNAIKFPEIKAGSVTNIDLKAKGECPVNIRTSQQEKTYSHGT
jgi:hypothetical protein